MAVSTSAKTLFIKSSTMAARITEKDFAKITKKTPAREGRYGANKRFTNMFGTWDSALEFNRWLFLDKLVRRGIIKDLARQERFNFDHNGVRIGYYTADFAFTIVETNQRIIEDTKPKAKEAQSRDVILRLKMMRAFYGHVVHIIHRADTWTYCEIYNPLRLNQRPAHHT